MKTLLLLQTILFLFISFFSQAQSSVVLVYDTPGAGNWTVPCGATNLCFTVIGGGGSGGGANGWAGGGSMGGGGGGGAGGAAWCCPNPASYSTGTVYIFDVGAGGAPGNPGTNGNNGGQTTIGIPTNPVQLYANGGSGGLSENNNGVPGNGGTASNYCGFTNGSAGSPGTGQNGGAGGGAGSPYGSPGGNGGTPGVYGSMGGNYGAGGGGGGKKSAGVNTVGGAGANGVVIITFDLPYTYPDAGNDINQCGPITLNANTPDAGWTGTWSVISGPAVVTSPNNPNSTVTGLTPGDCSVLRWTFSQAGCPDLYEEITVCSAVVCNDDCSGAISVVVNGACVNGDNSGATIIPENLNPACFASDYNNSVWFSFVATDDSITAVFTPGTLSNASMAVYSNCPATNMIACTQNAADLQMTGLSVGNTYYVLVDGTGTNTGTFCFSLFETLEEIGSSSLMPRKLYVGNDCTKSSGCAGTNQNNYIQGNTSDNGITWKTTSTGDWMCPGNDIGEPAYWVWFNSENNITVNFNNGGPGGSNMDYTLFSGPPAALIQQGCYTVNSGASSVIPVTPYTEYRVLVTPASASPASKAYLCVTAGDTYTPPNDNCVSATPITSNMNYLLSNSNATVDLDNTLCAGTTENNIWVYWVAEWTGPAFVNLQNQDCIESNGMQMSIFNADSNCPTSGSTCILYINPANDNNFFGQFNAVMGQTYYIQLDGYCGTGCSFDFCITPQGGANCNALATLPVELTSFRGEFYANKVELLWETVSEIDNDYFILDRSIDGVGWNTIQYIDGMGTTNQLTHYQTFDYETSATGIYYYRLTQVDFDGKRKSYVPISIQVKGTEDKELVKIVNLMGQEVDDNFTGVKIYVYSDGSSKKFF